MADGDELLGESVGHYRLVRTLGVGGMGAVYLGEHPEIQSRVAIKVLLPRFVENVEVTRCEATSEGTMTRIALEPTTLLQPHPVLLVGSYGADGKPNLMTAAWGGICCSDPPCVSVSLREATLTYHNILHSGAFTVGIPSREHVEAADYVGLATGRDCDKFRDTGLTPVKSDKVNAPLADELPFSLECKLYQHHKLGLHTIFIGEIAGIQAQEGLLGPKGLPDIEKTQAILWGGAGSNYYYAVGERLGRAFSVGRNLKQGQ